MDKLVNYIKNIKHTKEELKFDIFNNIKEKLHPKRPNLGDYSNSEEQIIANLDVIKDVCDYVQPTNILEIGFHRGASATMWLLHSKAKLKCIDISRISLASINTLHENFGDRFSFIERYDSKNIITDKAHWKNMFDLIFIDSDHSYYGVLEATKAALYLNPKYILYDDYYNEGHEKDIQAIIKLFVDEHKLSIVKQNYWMQCLVKVIKREK